jgi:hypothetical protein
MLRYTHPPVHVRRLRLLKRRVAECKKQLREAKESYVKLCRAFGAEPSPEYLE